MILSLQFALAALVSIYSQDAAGIEVVITRHGEKCVSGPCKPHDPTNLSPDGYARADYLAKCFATRSSVMPSLPFTGRDKIAGFDGKPWIFGPACHREKELAKPLAGKLGIKLNWFNCDTTTDFKCAKSHVEAAHKAGAPKIWLVWEHKNIPKLASALGLKNAPGWPSKCCQDAGGVDKDKSRNNPGCYDKIWTFQYPNPKGLTKLCQGFKGKSTDQCGIFRPSSNLTEEDIYATNSSLAANELVVV